MIYSTEKITYKSEIKEAFTLNTRPYLRKDGGAAVLSDKK